MRKNYDIPKNNAFSTWLRTKSPLNRISQGFNTMDGEINLICEEYPDEELDLPLIQARNLIFTDRFYSPLSNNCNDRYYNDGKNEANLLAEDSIYARNVYQDFTKPAILDNAQVFKDVYKLDREQQSACVTKLFIQYHNSDYLQSHHATIPEIMLMYDNTLDLLIDTTIHLNDLHSLFQKNFNLTISKTRYDKDANYSRAGPFCYHYKEWIRDFFDYDLPRFVVNNTNWSCVRK